MREGGAPTLPPGGAAALWATGGMAGGRGTTVEDDRLDGRRAPPQRTAGGRGATAEDGACTREGGGPTGKPRWIGPEGARNE